MNPKKIVLFGVNADPPHLGHLQVVQELERLLGQGTQFIIMPTGQHPFDKPQVASKFDRLVMARLLFQGYSHVTVSDYEINKNEKTYTLDTLIHLKSQFRRDRLYFVMAIDVANHFFSWKEPEKICQIATPIIVSRVGYHLHQDIEEKLQKMCSPLILNTNSRDISSTEIRQELHQKKNPKDLPANLYEYIKSHHLYENLSIS